MADWSAFYSVTATASAALLGLLFVAVSIAAPSALNDSRSPIRSLAEQSFQNYLLVLVLSGVALFPMTGARATGSVILFLTASRGIWALARLWVIMAHAPSPGARLKGLRRQITTLGGLACLLAASAPMAFGSGNDPHLLAAGTLILLTSSAVASWDLLLQLVNGRNHKLEG